jgi:hypothetical protein
MILAVAWIVTSFIMLYAIHRMERNIARERDKMWDERVTWKDERSELYDRIQSPSFAEYKHQEVKVIKAQNNTPEPPKLEVM